MTLIFNFRKRNNFFVIDGPAPNIVKFTGAFLVLGKCPGLPSTTYGGSLAPPVLALPFKETVSRRFCRILVFICFRTSVWLLPGLWGHHQASSGASPHPCPWAQDPAPLALQLASPVLLDWRCSDLLDWPWLATLPLPDAHRAVDSARYHHHVALLMLPGTLGWTWSTRAFPASTTAAPSSPSLREQTCSCISLTPLAVNFWKLNLFSFSLCLFLLPLHFLLPSSETKQQKKKTTQWTFSFGGLELFPVSTTSSFCLITGMNFIRLKMKEYAFLK